MPTPRGRYLWLVILSLTIGPMFAADTPLPPVSERAKRLTESAIVFDGHNDLPWRLRKDGDVKFETLDISKRLSTGHTDIPRAREGGLKAQFWSVYVPSDQPDPARSVVEQIDIVKRMVEKYPNDFELATTADDVERIAKAGKIASLLGVEGGVAIENSLAQLRAFGALGVRYMTLTHNTSLDWADSATGSSKNGGLSPFGERVVKEMNRLGMFVDISHVSADTMDDVLRISKAPVIASHSGARAIANHPRNVPDEILKRLPQNGGVVMVVFYPSFIVPGRAKAFAEARTELKKKFPVEAEFEKAYDQWTKDHPMPRGSAKDIADHIDHIVKVAGVDHAGVGSDYDGITDTPVGMEDVSCYPRLTEELLTRGYSDADIRKILGGNVIRALREAGKVAEELRKTTSPEVDPLKTEKD